MCVYVSMQLRPAMNPFSGRLVVPCVINLYFSADPVTGKPKV